MVCITPELRRALLAQVCCNNEELCEFLDCELTFIWECQDQCSPRLRYIYTQLGLIEAAQIFSRNKIDQMTRIAASNLQETFTALGTLLTTDERDSSGKECSWSASTSAQFFNKNAQDENIGFTDYRNLYTSEFKNNGYDKSCRHTTGYGFHMSRVDTSHIRDHSYDEDIHALRTSTTTGGTHPYLPITGLTNVGTVDFDGFTFNNPTPLSPSIQPAISSSQFCPNPTEENPIPGCGDENYYFPSAGQGWNSRFQFGIQLPLLGTLSVVWSDGFNQRQYFHCTGSIVDGTSNRQSNDRDYTDGFTRADEDDNQVYSSEQTDIAHLVRKFGITIRRGITELDGQEKGRGKSEGIRTAESQKDSQGTGYKQSRAEAETTRHNESHLRRIETANNDMISNKFGQISDHLAKLWERIWKEAIILERQFAAVPMIGSMNCNVRNPCPCPVRRSWTALNRATQYGLGITDITVPLHQ